MENKPKASPKDVFLQLLSIITLYFSAGALIDLLFAFASILFPDALDIYSSYKEYMMSSVRFDISALIIVFPAYLISNWLLGKEYKATPEKKELRIRKWLVYFTLFISALVLIGDLVFLVNNLLSGDLTTAILLKILSVFVVIGGIFLYYFFDIRKHSAEQPAQA
jgi:hypothetical protein